MESHRERADNYIGSANLKGQDDPAVQAALARAEAILVLADAVENLAAAVLTTGGIPANLVPRPA